MRICVSGTQNMGKTTFINDFLETYPMYHKSENDYRTLFKENEVKINQEGSKASQELIMNHIIDEHMKYKNTDHVIHDRGILDNVIHTIYLNDKHPEEVPEEFVQTSLEMCKHVTKFYDIIFLFTESKYNQIPIEEKKNRDTDPAYMQEMDFLFKAAWNTYNEGKPLFFNMMDVPGFIELFGSRDERVQMAKFYIDPETGDLYPQEKSLLTSDMMDI